MAKPKSSKAQATRRARAELRAQALRSVGVDVPNVGPGAVERLRRQLTGDTLNAYNAQYDRIVRNAGLRVAPPRTPPNSGRRAGGRARGHRLGGGGELFVSGNEQALWDRLKNERGTYVLVRVAFRDSKGNRTWETKALERVEIPGNHSIPLPVPGQTLQRFTTPGAAVQMTFGAQGATGVRVDDLLDLATAYSSLFFALYDLWSRIERKSP